MDNDRAFSLLSEITAYKARHLALPEALYEAGRKLAEADLGLDQIKKDLGDAKTAAKDSEIEIASEIGALKEQFPNETARKTETQRRLKLNLGHQVLVRNVAASETMLFQAEHARRLLALDVTRLENQQRALRAHADMTHDETLLLVGGSR